MATGRLRSADVEVGLRKNGGNMAAVARALKVSRVAVKKFVDRRPALLEIVRDLREAHIDVAEEQLHAAVARGEAWAVCFFLKTQAKQRGYFERAEVEHGGEVAVRQRIVEVIVDAPAD